MTTYTARIELQATAESDYKNLDFRMTEAGFAAPAKDSAPPNLQLSGPAEYVCESEMGLEGVFDAAREATCTLGKAFTILVCETSSKKWIGLRVSKPA